MVGYGTVRNVFGDKKFGFIRTIDGKDYFFHLTDYTGNWDALVKDNADKGRRIDVEFEITDSPKGPRARNVRRS